MKHLGTFRKINNYWWFYGGKYYVRNEEGEKICDDNIKTYIYQILFNKNAFAKALQIVNKTSGSRGTRLQNKRCGTSTLSASLKPINLSLLWLLTVVVALPHGCHMTTCRKSYFFRISPLGFDSETEHRRFDMDYFLDSPIKRVFYFINFRLYVTNRI